MDTQIRLIALDLDGTTLSGHGLTWRTKRTLQKAMKAGVHVVIATGRTFTALPRKLFRLKGLEYVITSNGAHITRLADRATIYANPVHPAALRQVLALLADADYPMEVFTDGRAYIDRSVYDELATHGSTYMNAAYVLRTRTPVVGIRDFVLAHLNEIENVNLHFPTEAARQAMKAQLLTIPSMTLTSSTAHNLEIGGETTSKATALQALCDLLHLQMTEVMACGDSHNDMAMLAEAGLGVAMENGEAEVKAMADVIAPGCDEDGVAWAVKKFVLQRLTNKGK